MRVLPVNGRRELVGSSGWRSAQAAERQGDRRRGLVTKVIISSLLSKSGG